MTAVVGDDLAVVDRLSHPLVDILLRKIKEKASRFSAGRMSIALFFGSHFKSNLANRAEDFSVAGSAGFAQWQSIFGREAV